MFTFFGGRACEAAGHRAFFKEVLEIIKCHQDVLHGNSRGLLLKYVAIYAPKFSDSFAREWLNDLASAWSVARRVLFDYQPAEPEMWLYIFAAKIPPCKYGGTMVPLRCPWPGMEAKPKLVENYEASEWRSEEMTLLEFLRKSNEAGDIISWVKDLHKADTKAGGGQSLESFANACPMKGQKLIACDMLSLFNDRWFGQWLALRKPFRDLEKLLDAEIVKKAGIANHAYNSFCGYIYIYIYIYLFIYLCIYLYIDKLRGDIL